MPKLITEMTDVRVRKLKKPGRYSVGGVKGLLLRVTPSGSKQWILRAATGEYRQSSTGKPFAVQRDFGLGGYPDVPLAEARETGKAMRKKLRDGVDPVAERKTTKLEGIRARQASQTFRQVADAAYAVKAQEFRNPKHAAQWYATLERYAFPFIGDIPINDVTTADIERMLEPIWTEKTETANRVRQRASAVFRYALAGDHPIRANPVNPAEWLHLKDKMAAPEKVRKKHGKALRHHPALPVADVPRLMSDLATRDAPSAYALRFAVLTAARSGEVRLARWDEIDLEARVWRLSAERMKADKAHAVPLSTAAVAILEALPRGNGAGLVFPSKRGSAMSDMALSKLLKDAHAADLKKGGAGYFDPEQAKIATPHGTARSSFKDWSRIGGRFPDEWSELALAHINSDETRAAYARNMLLEDRRGMMELWGEHCAPSLSGGRVVAFEKVSA